MTGAEPRLWAVVGATGTGKTAAALALAEHLAEQHGRASEIVNGDAMQLYRGMEIGTAKIPLAERRGIPHHLFAALDPSEEATVAGYQPVARATIRQILDRGRDAILVGGSGLYVSSVLFDFDFPPRDPEVRRELEAALAAAGVEALLERLRARDPEAAASVDPRNPRRVVRALEVSLLGGAARTRLPERPRMWLPDTRILGLRTDRAVLVERLDRRVERMWASGLLEEVAGLLTRGLRNGPTASRAIGYAQAIEQLDGGIDEEEAIARTQALTRRYARRQVSWFSRYADARWIDTTEADAPGEELARGI